MQGSKGSYPEDAPKKRGTGWLSLLPFLFCGVILLCGVAAKFVERCPVMCVWDDAYMFARYADNLLAHGRIAWNPGGEPMYGLTSPLFLMVVTPLRTLFPGDPMRVVLLSSLLCGGVWLGLLFWLISRSIEAPRPVKLGVL